MVGPRALWRLFANLTQTRQRFSRAVERGGAWGVERRASGRCAEKMVASWCDREVWDVGKVLLRALSGGNGLDTT